MIAAVVLFIVLAAFFGVTYYLNAKTPVPEGCEKLKEDCVGCAMVHCPNRAKGENHD